MKQRTYFYTLLLCLLLAYTARAQTPAATATPMLTFNHIALHVHDLPKSAAFYEQVMGLTKIPDPFRDDRHAWYSIGEPLQLHLIQGAPPEIFQDVKRHLCFSVKSIEDFRKHLARHNIRYHNNVGVPDSITIRPDGIEQLYIQDPDGHWLEINNEVLQP